jgi:hypothetical protein
MWQINSKYLAYESKYFFQASTNLKNQILGIVVIVQFYFVIVKPSFYVRRVKLKKHN